MVKVAKTYLGGEDKLPAWTDRLVSILGDGLYRVLVRKGRQPGCGSKKKRRSAEEGQRGSEKGRVEVGGKLPS